MKKKKIKPQYLLHIFINFDLSQNFDHKYHVEE